MARKTIDVEQVKASVNHALNDSDALYWQEHSHGVEGAKAYRMGVIAVLESVLTKTGNYAGYSEPADLVDGTRRRYL
jgi:hypothetical protein